MFKIYELDGTERQAPTGVSALDLYVSSVQYDRDTETLEDVPGVIDYGGRDASKDLEAKIFFRLASTDEWGTRRQEIYNYFSGRFYIEEDRLPGRWHKVMAPGSFKLSRFDNNRLAGEQTIPLETVDLPYAESKDPILEAYTGGTFTINVDGTEAVEPYHQHLKITLENIQGSTSHVELYNTTNGSSFYITEMLDSSKTVEVDGVTVKIDNLQALRRTTREFITLSPGINVIELRGATSTEFSLEYKNYYR